MSFKTLAAEYHGGQWTALYRYSCNGRVLDFEHRGELILELESILAKMETYDDCTIAEMGGSEKYYREYIRVQSFLVFVYETECDDSPANKAAAIMEHILEYDEGKNYCTLCRCLTCGTNCMMLKMQQWVDNWHEFHKPH